MASQQRMNRNKEMLLSLLYSSQFRNQVTKEQNQYIPKHSDISKLNLFKKRAVKIIKPKSPLDQSRKFDIRGVSCHKMRRPSLEKSVEDWVEQRQATLRSQHSRRVIYTDLAESRASSVELQPKQTQGSFPHMNNKNNAMQGRQVTANNWFRPISKIKSRTNNWAKTDEEQNSDEGTRRNYDLYPKKHGKLGKPKHKNNKVVYQMKTTEPSMSPTSMCSSHMSEKQDLMP